VGAVEVGGGVAHEFVRVAAFDERQSLGEKLLQLDRATSEPSCSRWLRRCACSLSSSSRSTPFGGAVEQVDRAPEQVVEVGFEPGVLQRGDQGVEDVGDGAGDAVALGKRAGVGSSWKGGSRRAEARRGWRTVGDSACGSSWSVMVVRSG
jgi:hypothetical protein